MRKIEQIAEQIAALSGTEYTELRKWFLERDWEMWDAEFEGDVRAGKLHALGEAARRAHAAGKTTKL